MRRARLMPCCSSLSARGRRCQRRGTTWWTSCPPRSRSRRTRTRVHGRVLRACYRTGHTGGARVCSRKHHPPSKGERMTLSLQQRTATHSARQQEPPKRRRRERRTKGPPTTPHGPRPNSNRPPVCVAYVSPLVRACLRAICVPPPRRARRCSPACTPVALVSRQRGSVACCRLPRRSPPARPAYERDACARCAQL